MSLFAELHRRNVIRVGIAYTVVAWGGHRKAVNSLVAKIDQHHFGLVPLAQLAIWCGCGAPWDLEATPNFAAKLEESGLRWPPEPIMEFPLKDWLD